MKTIKLARTIAFASLIFLGLTGCNDAELQGTVVDETGKPLDAVEISISNADFHTRTDAQGHYTLTYVPGRFDVNYQKPGYHPVKLSFDLAAKDTVPVKQQSLTQISEKELIIGAFERTIDFINAKYTEYYQRHGNASRAKYELNELKGKFLANLRNAKFGKIFSGYIAKFSDGSTFIMTFPAYIKLGYPAIFDFTKPDTIDDLPGPIKSYAKKLIEGDKIIEGAKRGDVELNDPKFLQASEICFLTGAGLSIRAIAILTGSTSEVLDSEFTIKSASAFRDFIAKTRSSTSSPR